MNNINCLIVEGNITRTPEFKTTAHGFPVCRLPIAVNHYYKKANTDEYVDEVSYFDVETFGKLAEICAKLVRKEEASVSSEELNRTDGKPKKESHKAESQLLLKRSNLNQE